MSFNESNTVEAFVRDLLVGLGWEYLSRKDLPRQTQDVLAEEHLREALIRLNPPIAAQPDRADDVLYRLRAIIMGVRSDGLVKANEEFAAWLTGERSMPFGPDGEHVTIRLIDFDNLSNNRCVVTQQFTFRAGKTEKRADLVLLINGMPLVVIEAKTPVRSSESWLDGALQVHRDYEPNIPELFVPNVFSVATEGKEYRYGSIRMPVELWGPWRLDDEEVLPSMAQVEKAVTSQLRPGVILDLLANFTTYATHKGKQRIKIIARYQQVDGTNKIVHRVVTGYPKKGLIWHFQGSGKSLLMLFAARKLRLHPALKNPTVIIVLDRVDLDTQISGTFHAAAVANTVNCDKRSDLKAMLASDVRKIVITRIFTFGDETLRQRASRILRDARKALAGGRADDAWYRVAEVEAIASAMDGTNGDKVSRSVSKLRGELEAIAPPAAGAFERDFSEFTSVETGLLNDRDNIITMVDEAHRTQEGDLGRKMREALPNAFLFGLTGTPINRADKNTFYAFGAEEDVGGYLSRYGFEESLRDGATKELHFEPRLVDLHVDQGAIDEAYKEITSGLTDDEKDKLSKKAAKMAVLLKAPERVQAVCADIAQHFQEKVAPNGFGAMVVTPDREGCLLYKKAIDQHLPPEMSDIVMSVNSDEPEYAPYDHDRDAEAKLLGRFRDSSDPLKILIVTAKLLTGFDAPILQAMYLDKPLRDHTLLQAICRTNRPYGQEKSHGLIVDYIGIFDDVAQAIQFDEEGITKVVSNISNLKGQLPAAVQKCLAYFAGVDRELEGYEGLMAAQDCLPNNKVRDQFAADCSYLMRLWEAISPDTVLGQYETDYRWLVQVYESVKPVSDTGKLLWHSLGAKTIELIHQNVHVDAVRDDLETLVIDADLLEAVLGTPDPKKKAKEIEIKVARRLRKHLHDPRFKELAERLEALKERHEQGLMTSVDFLKNLLNLATDVVAAEKSVPPIEQEERGKAALTELFEEARGEDTPIIVGRIVADVDEIVRNVRFDGWQNTHAGERDVKKALRKTLFKYKLHQDAELFDRAFGYIQEYY